MKRILVVTGLVVALGGLSLVGVIGQAGDQAPALGGYCPVAYSVAGKALKGDLKFSSEHEGRRYLFVNADAKQMFDANPAKFTIAYDSWCATAMAQGKKIASDPTRFTVLDGVTYLFSSRDAKTAFDKDKAGVVQKANEQWKRMR